MPADYGRISVIAHFESSYGDNRRLAIILPWPFVGRREIIAIFIDAQ